MPLRPQLGQQLVQQHHLPAGLYQHLQLALCSALTCQAALGSIVLLHDKRSLSSFAAETGHLPGRPCQCGLPTVREGWQGRLPARRCVAVQTSGAADLQCTSAKTNCVLRQIACQAERLAMWSSCRSTHVITNDVTEAACQIVHTIAGLVMGGSAAGLDKWTIFQHMQHQSTARQAFRMKQASTGVAKQQPTVHCSQRSTVL